LFVVIKFPNCKGKSMGELKTLRKEQETLVARARELNHKLYLAGAGVLVKAEAESGKWIDKYAAAGSNALGEQAEGKARVLLVARGLVESARTVDARTLADTLTGNARNFLDVAPEKGKEIYEECVNAGREGRGDKAGTSNEFVLAGLGALLNVRSKGQKVFNDLVSAGTARVG
jgi:hypothetical protein